MPAASYARKTLTALTGSALALAGLSLVTPAAHAASAGLVISEVYGGGGNSGAQWKNDFVELYNPTDTAIPLTGLSLQYRSAGNTGTGVTALSGTVAPHKTFLVQEQGGTNGSALPAPDKSATDLNLSGTNGMVFLANTADLVTLTPGSVTTNPAVIDLVGYGSANVFETAPAGTLSNTTSAARAASGADNDNNSTDFTVGAPTPTNAAGETDPPVSATPVVASPGNKTFALGQAISAITLSATGGTAPYTWTSSTLPAGLSLSGNTISGTPTAAGATDVTVTATDSAATPAAGTATFRITVVDATAVIPIAEIQGTGAESPRKDATVTTEGVVTALYRSGGFNGMYIQTGGTGGPTDATPGASDAVFVYGGGGAANLPAGVELGDSVRVTGVVSEFNGLTELTPASAGGVTELATALPAVTPLATAYPTTDTDREAHEGELLAPTDPLVVTNSYSTNRYAEIGLATGDTPLVQPTEIKKSTDAAGIAQVKADNAKRAVTLDDGQSIDFLPSGDDRSNMNIPLPWLTKTNAVRVGARVTLHQAVVLDYRNNLWKFQPTAPVTDDGHAVATFEDTRTPNQTPQTVGGDLKIATFNVLNYFNTTGEQYVANGAAQSPAVNTQCTYYNDRAGNPIADNTCGVVTNGTNAGNGPRGAATQANFLRQQAKIVKAINTLGADIVGLEEIENSVKLVGETNRDDAVAALVAALNAEAGAGTWDFVHSPAEGALAANVSLQDVIRPAFIFKPAKVRPVGQSDIYFEASANASGSTPAGAFANAREPLAQAFKPAGAPDSAAFGVIVNHFKSKGDSNPPATGDNANGEQGAFNGDRVRQATKLAEFADAFAAARGIDAVFLAGDFNSYSQEDPMQVLYGAGFDPIESDGEETYSFGGMSGSLDHVLGNAAAMSMVTDADVWDINASESVGYQYSRFNYNATDLFDGTTPFAASDHNPEIVGLDVPDFGTDFTEVQVLGTNDFHGRILADGANAAGAAVLSGAVKELRGENPNTVFAAAGDLIGASTFESFIQHDEPTIDALNEAGLQVSAAGNHEFDNGYEDLAGRVQDRAGWEYIAANIEEPAGRDDLAESWTKTFGDVKVGFVGAVTEDLPSLVSPAGMTGVTVTDIVESVNAETAKLKDDGADLVVLLVHEGASNTNCASADFTDASTVWGNIVKNTSPDVDAIVSGHTHLSYNCSIPVQAWAAEGRAVTKRPVVSAGQYGTFLNQLVFTVDNATGEVAATTQDVIGLVGTGYPADPAVTTIVDAAKAQAEELGKQQLGKLGGGFTRAKFAGGGENRGGESTLGNLVAEVQRAQTPATVGGAQIAFMNPGGLRADMLGGVTGETAYPKTLTYKQAANVQPFANTLVNLDLTGAQIKTVLEQQWQRDSKGVAPTRAFLKLGLSKGFTYTYTQAQDPAQPAGVMKGTVTGMWLDGVAIDPAASYSVTVNSFLASGGDNFFELAKGTAKQDTGITDLQAMVDYMKAHGTGTGLPVDYGQRAVGVTFPADAPASYSAGDHVRFDLFSLSMTGAASGVANDPVDTEVQVKLGDAVLGTFPVTTTVSSSPDNSAGSNDDAGKASVDVTLPTVPAGAVLTVVGTTTGTAVRVPVTLVETPAPSKASVTLKPAPVTSAYGRSTRVRVQLVTSGKPSGMVTLAEGSRRLGSVPAANGWLTFPVGTALTPGTHHLTVSYPGDATHESATKTFSVRVAKAAVRVSATVRPHVVKVRKGRARVTIRVTGADGVVANGLATVKVKGQGTVRVSVRNGKATVRLPKFRTTGKKTITVSYLGSGTTDRGSDRVSVRVTR